MTVRISAMGRVLTLVGFATPCISVQAGVIVGRQVRVDQNNGFAAAETAIVASRVNPVRFQYSAYLPVVACINGMESLRAVWVC